MTSIAWSRSKASAAACSRPSKRSAAAKTRSPRPPAGNATPKKRAALIDEGKRLKSSVAEEEERLRRLEAEIDPAAAARPQPDPSRRPRRPHRRRQPRAPHGRHAPRLRFQAQGPRRARESTRPDRFRNRRQGQRNRLLFPQERRRPARPGTSAIRPAEIDRRRLHSHHHSRPGPEYQSWKGSASRRAGSKPRSTRSKTPSSA